jgi:hypothetical protein
VVQQASHERGFTDAVAIEHRGKGSPGARLHQRHQTQLRKPARPAGSARSAVAVFERRRVGQVNRGAVDADQAPPLIPGPGRARLGQGPRHRGIKLAQRFRPQPGAGLGDGRFAGDRNMLGAAAQPAQAFDQAPQDLAAGHRAVQRQGDHIVDHQLCRQLPLPTAVSAGRRQYLIDQGGRQRRRQHAQTDKVADPDTVEPTRRLPSHGRASRPERSSPLLTDEGFLSERHWG